MSRQYDDAMDQWRDNRLATRLDLTNEELARAPYEIDTDESNDGGLVYSLLVTFGEDSDPEVLAKIEGLEEGRVVRLEPHLFDRDEEDPDA